MFGKRISYDIRGQKIHIAFEQRIGIIEIFTDKIINVFSGLYTESHHSYSIEGDKIKKTEFSVEETDEYLRIQTDCLCVQVYNDFKVDFYGTDGTLLCEDYRKEREYEESVSHASLILASQEGHEISLLDKTHKIEIVKTMFGDESFYGLGDKAGYLNKKYFEYEMWNSNIPAPHMESFKSLYKSIPFFIALRKECVYGIFYDNHFKTYFDMGKENEQYYFMAADDGNIDYYFIYGDEMKEVVSGYAHLTGTHELPQRWTLGYHQSRWSYESEEELKEIAEKLRELEIPCDALYLDIDHMERFKVFTWNQEAFPDPYRMVQNMEKMGFKIVTIVDPAIKVEEGYDMYEEGMEEGHFLTTPEGDVYLNKVWPGTCAYPDFSQEKTRKWWAKKEQALLDTGVAGIWNDMNEPASFAGELPEDVVFHNDGNKTTHKEMHNLYGNQMAQTTYEALREHSERRPFIITRACFSGAQKYCLNWTGDNQSLWPHLKMAVPQMCNMGLSGIGFTGTDIGGYGFDCTKELLSRWIQVGCFSPLFRNHSSRPSRHQEPWKFTKETLDINRKYISLRYEWIPYFYDLFREMEKSGLPILRPLVLEYPADERVREISDQFMVGESVLVAPVVEQGARMRMLYLPHGNWVDYWTYECIEGGRYIVRDAPLNTCPIYIKENTILPKYEVQEFIGDKEFVHLILEVYGTKGQYQHYQDNGIDRKYRVGEYNEYKFDISMEQGKAKFQVEMLNQGYKVRYKDYTIKVNGRTVLCDRKREETVS